MAFPRLRKNMRSVNILLAAIVLLGSQSAFAATKETYAHKMEMGNMLYFNGDVERAIKAFQRAGELNPKAFEPHLSLVNLWLQKGGDDAITQAENECKAVLALKPQHRDCHLILGNLLRTEAGTLTDKDKMNAKLDEAAAEVAKAEELGANEALCENTIGLILLQRGDTDKALAHIDNALKKQPVYPDAHLIKGVLLFKQIGVDKINDPAMKDKLQQVFDELDLAVKQKDKNAEAHHTKAEILFAAGKYHDSAKEYEAAVKDEPRYVQSWAGLGNVHAQLSGSDSAAKDDHLGKAKEAYSKAKKLKPDDKNIVYGLAVMLEKQGLIREALQEFNEGILMETDPIMKQQIFTHIQQLQQAAGGLASIGLPSIGSGTGGGTAGASVGNNIFTSGALSQPFSSLIKLKDPKEKSK